MSEVSLRTRRDAHACRKRCSTPKDSERVPRQAARRQFFLSESKIAFVFDCYDGGACKRAKFEPDTDSENRNAFDQTSSATFMTALGSSNRPQSAVASFLERIAERGGNPLPDTEQQQPAAMMCASGKRRLDAFRAALQDRTQQLQPNAQITLQLQPPNECGDVASVD
eukprot:TRINITY_DN8421_c0_g1_i2.p1 TRINITY_DN8421_c0_g1~~TRINITY_DN8421_c0_g1_i2.p1  ORF type:complete len:168 (-),score=12.21 TRINITY_DN8421_c0_g1_i2:272-775(-)